MEDLRLLGCHDRFLDDVHALCTAAPAAAASFLPSLVQQIAMLVKAEVLRGRGGGGCMHG